MQPARPEGAIYATRTPGRGNICNPHARKGQHMQPSRPDQSDPLTTYPPQIFTLHVLKYFTVQSCAY
jgi:hypothetical protein